MTLHANAHVTVTLDTSSALKILDQIAARHDKLLRHVLILRGGIQLAAKEAAGLPGGGGGGGGVRRGGVVNAILDFQREAENTFFTRRGSPFDSVRRLWADIDLRQMAIAAEAKAIAAIPRVGPSLAEAHKLYHQAQQAAIPEITFGAMRQAGVSESVVSSLEQTNNMMRERMDTLEMLQGALNPTREAAFEVARAAAYLGNPSAINIPQFSRIIRDMYAWNFIQAERDLHQKRATREMVGRGLVSALAALMAN